MREIQLSPKELIYIASILGAKEFFGVPDPFFGMARNEIVASIDMIQTNLTSKGLLEMDFSGTIRVQEDVACLIKKCAFCDSYIAGAIQGNTATKQIVFYCKETEIFALISDDDLLCIYETNISDAIHRIMEMLDSEVINIPSSSSKTSSRFSSNIIEKTRKEALAGQSSVARQEMLLAGISAPIASVFLNSFQTSVKLYVFVATSFVKKKVESLLCINSDGSLVTIEKCEDSEHGTWLAEEVSGEEYFKKLEAQIERFR